MMDQTKLEAQIAALKAQRDDELRSRKWMSSRPDRINSYGNFSEIESKVNEKYDTMIQGIQKEMESSRSRKPLDAPPSKENLAKRRKFPNAQKECTDPKAFARSSSKSDLDSVESSFSCGCAPSGSQSESDDDDSSSSSNSESSSSTDKDKKVTEISTNASNSEHDSARAGSESDDDDSSSSSTTTTRSSIDNGVHDHRKEVIEINTSSSSSEDESSSTSSHCGSLEMQAKSDQEDAQSNNNEEGVLNFNFDRTEDASDDLSDVEEDDETVVHVMKQFYAPEIKNSKLFMAAQGFQRQKSSSTFAYGQQSSDKEAARKPLAAPFDPTFVDFNGKTFFKGKCYALEEGEKIIGIKRFVPGDSCMCVLISKFEDTILGREDERVLYNADLMTGTYVQVFKCEEKLSLLDLGDELQEISEIPSLIYELQTPGSWYSFGYFYDRNHTAVKCRREVLTSLELFAGAGGSLQGYHNAGFETVMAIENDKDAVITLKNNNEGIRIYDGCIKQFIQDYSTLACALGHINHLHFSSPCQDFSTANRAVANSPEVIGPRERADLSLLLIDLIRLTCCETAVFENVVGIWRKNNVHYLFNIAKEVMKLGYQVRCTVLYACDYGDPQKRPRFFMFIAKNNVPMPSIPPATHGKEAHLWPYVTVKDALDRLPNDSSLPNMQGRETNLKPGLHGHIRLDSNEVAPTLRCSGGTPFHYSEDRLINVRESATLQSFPLKYTFYGSIRSQYRQVGNAVPIELSTAVAQSFRNVLQYKYE